MSVTDPKSEKTIQVELSESELRYLVACGFALLQNIPAKSLSTYSSMSKDEIISFSKKIRQLMDENDISI